METTTVTSNTDIQALCDKTATRYTLGGVLISPAASLAAATNGKALAIAEVETVAPYGIDETGKLVPIEGAEHPAAIVPLDILKGGGKKPKIIDMNGRATRKNPGKMDTTADFLDGRFPNIGHMAQPTDSATIKIALDAKLLYELAQALCPLGRDPDDGLCVMLEFSDNKGAVSVVPTSNTKAAGLLMPISVTETRSPRAEFNALCQRMETK